MAMYIHACSTQNQIILVISLKQNYLKKTCESETN